MFVDARNIILLSSPAQLCFFCELTWKGEIATGGRRVGLSLPTPVTVCRPKTGSTLRFVSSFRHRLAVSRKKRRTALGPILQRETSISDRRQCRTKRFFFHARKPLVEVLFCSKNRYLRELWIFIRQAENRRRFVRKDATISLHREKKNIATR